MIRRFALWLRPAGWPPLPAGVRPRVRALAGFAVASQSLFVLGWIVAGALERGYSPLRMYISELGRRGAEHPWIFDASVVVWGAGFIALAAAMRPGLRSGRLGWAAPALFLLAGFAAVLEAPLRLDCAASVDRACAAHQAAGTLSWHHYAHNWAAFVIAALLVLTPFALAVAEWRSRIAWLTLAAGVIGALLWVASIAGPHHQPGGDVGLWQRIGLLVVHGWVFACAAALWLEASPGWPPPRARPREQGIGEALASGA